jgi:polyisoprenoid-binding protein YceI
MTRMQLSLALSVFALACAKDPTEGKTKAAVSEPKAAPTAPAAPTAVTEKLAVTPAASAIGFVGAKVTAQHVGKFSDFTGTITLVDGAPEKSRVEFDVKVAAMSVDGGNESLEKHLRSADFFDVEKFPSAKFVSTEIKAGSDAPGMTHTVTGNLELRGTTKGVTFPANITVEKDAVRVKTEFGINRRDFNIVYPGAPDDLIKDNVLIQVSLEAKRG